MIGQKQKNMVVTDIYPIKIKRGNREVVIFQLSYRLVVDNPEFLLVG